MGLALDQLSPIDAESGFKQVFNLGLPGSAINSFNPTSGASNVITQERLQNSSAGAGLSLSDLNPYGASQTNQGISDFATKWGPLILAAIGIFIFLKVRR